MRRRVAITLLAAVIAVGCGNSNDTIVLQTDSTPMSGAERLQVESALAGASDIQLAGRVDGPQETAILVTYRDDATGDPCWAVVRSDGHTVDCGPRGTTTSRVLGETDNGGVVGLVVDTSQPGVRLLRVTVGDGTTYEVDSLGDLSYIAFTDAGGGFTLSLVGQDQILDQETFG